MSTSLVLVINCGSSSLKFALYETHSALSLLAEGLAESLNQATGSLTISQDGSKEQHPLVFENKQQNSHFIALEACLSRLSDNYNLGEDLVAIGHRVVHGGKIFSSSVKIDDQVLSQIKACIPLAPLHNPANVTGIECLQQHYPKLPQIAVFDTAFHQTMPPHAYIYALPYKFYEQDDVRRYGFHGTSHRYITAKAAQAVGKSIETTNIITAHLGNGASVAAIKDGRSVDTSMGLTPLEGLVMGTRSGDIDPGIFDFLHGKGHSLSDISTILNKQSGLLGISGLSNDMRTLCEKAAEGHSQAQLAVDVFCFRAAKYLAGMMTSLSTVDALVFTGGIGENSALVRASIVKQMSVFGFTIDPIRNESRDRKDEGFGGTSVHQPPSHPILVIPTDEESMIVEDTLALI
jgi:acetate kinase